MVDARQAPVPLAAYTTARASWSKYDASIVPFEAITTLASPEKIPGPATISELQWPPIRRASWTVPPATLMYEIIGVPSRSSAMDV